MNRRSFLLGASILRAVALPAILGWAGAQDGMGVDTVAPPAASTSPQPVVAGPEGRRAFDDLAAAYGNRSGLFESRTALKDLQSRDAGTARRAGTYLLALFQQSLADESNGRAGWNPTPFTNEGPDNRARDDRQALAKDFGASASSEAGLPAAIWLIENDPIGEDAEAGVHVLSQVRSEAANTAIARVIAEVHPNQKVLVTALREAGTRRLAASKKDITALEQSYRIAVREAAVRAAAQLGETSPSVYDPLKAFSPRVVDLLKRTLERIRIAVPADAPWLDGMQQPDWSPGQPYAVHGWLLDRNGASTTFLDVFGQTRTVTADRVAFTPGELGKAAEHLASVQEMVAKEKARYEVIQASPALRKPWTPVLQKLSTEMGALDRDMDARLQEMTAVGLHIGPPGGRFLNLPELTVAAWCWQRGDLAHAAQLLFPCYNAAEDDRWLDWASRDDLGNIYDLELLQKFTVERDYPASIALASHLGSPAFDGYAYQARSKELAAQLARRSEDFTTLTLPTAAEWLKIKSGLGRAEQITWLASRLKLMHCINPGYDQVQYAKAHPNDYDPKWDPEVINPYNELLALNLTPADLLTLAPFAADQDYSPSYTFYKDWIPDRGLCRVAGAVGELINHVAGRSLVHEAPDGIAFEGRSAATVVADLQAWIATHHDDTPDKLLAQTLKTSTDWVALHEAAVQALKIHQVELLDLLANRLDGLTKFSKSPEYQEADMVHLFYGSHAPMVDHARQWVKSPYPEVRFWAALILIRDGDVAHEEGFDTLEPLLAGEPMERRYTQAALTLLRSPSPRARRVADAVFQKMDRHRNQGNDLTLDWMYKLYFVAGHRACLDYLLGILDDYTIDPNTHDASGPPVYITESQIFWLSSWGRHLTETPRTVPDIHRYREKLKKWLTEQFALIEQGKPSAVRTVGAEYQDTYEQDLNPAPIRRHTAEQAAATQD